MARCCNLYPTSVCIYNDKRYCLITARWLLTCGTFALRAFCFLERNIFRFLSSHFVQQCHFCHRRQQTDMASHSSLPFERRHSRPNPRSASKKSNGRSWFRSGMIRHSPDTTVFSFRSMFSPIPSPTNMLQPPEQIKEPPQPAGANANGGLLPAPDYVDKSFGRFHQHSVSDCTASVGSNDSSPTTTCSTVDDSSATEPSPGKFF